MSLSNSIIKNLLLKSTLKLKELEDKKSHNKEITNKAKLLLSSDINSLQKTFVLANRFEDLLISYIISVTFLRTNTTIQLSDTKGKSMLFFNTGNVGLVGKQKRQRKLAITRLVQLLFTKFPRLAMSPVAIHLKNVRIHKTFTLECLKKRVLIRIIRSFSQIPYNGCRKRKIRRKKHAKNTIK